MHVLQHTVRRLVHGIAEIGRKAVVPGGLKLTHQQITGHQRTLEIKAHEHMQVVLQLIRFGADEARPNAVDRGIECIFVLHAEIAKSVFHLTEQPAGKGAAAADLVFVDPALALMNAHADATAQRGQQVAVADVLLIGGVANLVDGGIETIERVGGVRTCGDAHVQPRAGGERMHSLVHAPPRHVIAEGLGERARQLHLRALVKCAG